MTVEVKEKEFSPVTLLKARRFVDSMLSGKSAATALRENGLPTDELERPTSTFREAVLRIIEDYELGDEERGRLLRAGLNMLLVRGLRSDAKPHEVKQAIAVARLMAEDARLGFRLTQQPVAHVDVNVLAPVFAALDDPEN